ncbi:hypothetical protein SLEP1_g46595 [Rubroshorea leprosula]|uniref:Bifunctional inhibitor/plant lipid transfer protein/seed storage helical domain-containing protein n=1 Tax=Rubroshorea leprosula TaxID=152421 RepID=A0AAV5LNH8_9ROSI|nr:hypothetical protein SLEP1_g46595 [Rubroshorea leprosula]
MAETGEKLMVQLLVAVLLTVLVAEAEAVVMCNIEMSNMELCRAAVTGRSPPSPTRKCCSLLRQANFPCLCNLKSVLPSLGINPRHALALPRKCNLVTPPECRRTV